MPARQGAGCAFNHAMIAALVRPSTWASRPPVPAASTNPLCHRSQASTTGACPGLGPRWVCRGGSHRSPEPSPGAAAPQWYPDVLNERGVHAGPVHAEVGGGFGYNPALFGDHVSELGPQLRRQPRACPHCRPRLRERGPGQSLSLQRHRRLCQISRNALVPYEMSRGRVQTRPLR